MARVCPVRPQDTIPGTMHSRGCADRVRWTGRARGHGYQLTDDRLPARLLPAAIALRNYTGRVPMAGLDQSACFLTSRPAPAFPTAEHTRSTHGDKPDT